MLANGHEQNHHGQNDSTPGTEHGSKDPLDEAPELQTFHQIRHHFGHHLGMRLAHLDSWSQILKEKWDLGMCFWDVGPWDVFGIQKLVQGWKIRVSNSDGSRFPSVCSHNFTSANSPREFPKAIGFEHGSLNVPIEHHPTIRYIVYNGYYFW